MMARIVHALSAGLGVAFLVLPIVVVMPLAFNDSTFLAYPMNGFTLRWFSVVFTKAPWMASLANSLVIACGAMVLSLLVGGLAAVGTAQVGKIQQAVLSALFISPLVLPSVIFGVAIAYAAARVGATGTYLSLILAHTVLGAPLVYVSIINGLKGLDQDLEQAAASLGARRWYRFRTVILPLTLPSFLSGALLAFMSSFDEVVVALFLSSPQTITLPIVLFSSLRDQLEPTLVVVSLLLTLLSMLLLIVLRVLDRRTAIARKV
ncbi:ABC transporter permease (plasmid) [Brucella anthropi]|uniref:ABC transporter permease n=1 Tax=Brucella anthropi TaxID=529 RepID=UPI00188C68F0|nr:ABC transporter permease [Brucella anthropi]QPA29862.1 ABC transporter permease [Brucella anthropi]